jgi:hypothetical protein
VAFIICQLAVAWRFFLAQLSRMSTAALLKAGTHSCACLRLAVAVFVVLLCTFGIAGKAQAQFAPPTVTGISPNTGPAAGGTSVVIGGTNFFVVTAVRFGGNAASFVVNNPNQITATSPAGTGIVGITVTAAGGTSAPSAASQFTYGPSNSTTLRAMQVSTTPIIAQISGQAITGAIDNAIGAGFSDNPPALTPNGGGFSVQIPLDQPPPVTGQPIVTAPVGSIGSADTLAIGRQTGHGPGSLANGGQGGNGAPPGTRLIDMAVMPLPPGSGMPPLGETGFSPNEVVLQFASGTTPDQVAAIARRFGLTLEARQSTDMLGRAIYLFRITNGHSVRQIIRAVEVARVNAAVQPNYTYRPTQDQREPNADLGDPAQYIVNKLHLAGAHQISDGDDVVIAVIDTEIDFNQPNLAGSITDRYDAGCGATSPDLHGTGMAGAIAAHGQLLGVAPNAKIIAICAFGGTSQPQSNSIKIIKALDYAVQHGARIVNMSFAGARDPALSQALQIAREKGILLIAAAGNAGPKSPPLYPGADPSVMAVTATDENDHLFNGANQGEYVAIASPGVNVLVPAPDEALQLTTGTSVAAANVSGVAALLIARNPSLKPEQIREILVRTAKALGPTAMNPQFGAGLVDPLKALKMEVSDASPAQPNDLNSFLASPNGNAKRVGDGFSALGYAPDGGLVANAPAAVVAPRVWLAWFDVRGTDFERDESGSDLRGTQVNGLAGLTHRVTPNFLVGVLGGYEHFDYSSQAFNGVLRGDGWTAGAYLGWRLLQNLRFDAGGAWSDVFTNDTSGMASGNFLGHRWLVTSGLTGTVDWRTVVFEPSAHIYALWEQEDAYTDSLGTLQAGRDFATGRASAGVKVSYPFTSSSMTSLAPYAGLYGDYYFSMDNAAPVGITTVPLLQGWSGRATAGVVITVAPGALLSAGGEYGGIGGNTHIWTWQLRGSVPF